MKAKGGGGNLFLPLDFLSTGLNINPLNPSGHYMYHQFNIHNSTFCPHSVFMCFVWISEQTAIISLYNINWLVFITETECVYCAVRTECLIIIQDDFII